MNFKRALPPTEFLWIKVATSSAYADSKPEDNEPNGAKHLDSHKHSEFAKERIGAEYTSFWSFSPQRWGRFDIASVFRYNLKNSWLTQSPFMACFLAREKS
jgi:hypothetical protein